MIFEYRGGRLVKNGNTFIFSYHQKELLRQYFHVPQKSSLNESFHYQSVLVSENQYGFDVIDGYSSLSQTASIIQSEMISSSNSPLFYRYWTIGIVTDTNECAYICGYTWIYCIHTKPGGYSVNEDYDIFVFSLDSTGSSIRYSTFIGGSNTDKSSGIAIDADNNVYVCGYTDSSNFPTTKDSYDTTYNNRFDVYVFKLDSTGSELLYSTYIGGDHVDIADCICIDDANNAYICGWTYSTIFPVTSTKYDSHPLVLHNYVLKLNHQGANIEYSMYIGGSEIVCFRKNAVDAAGYLYVCGWTEAHDFYTTPNAYNTTINGSLDCFVFAVNPEGDGLQYSTFVGGNECGEKWEWDVAEDICIDSSGNVYVCGFTNSLDFPTTIDSLDTTYNGQKDGFILVLNAELEQLIYSTYIGGSKNDYIKRMEIDADGNAFVCGWTGSSDFPTTPNAYDTTYNGCIDCFVFALNPFENVMLYSTFVGGGSEDICLDFTLDKKGNTYVCGYTNSSDFPTSKDAYDPTYNGQEDCFVFALTPDGSNLIYSTFIVLEGY